MTSTKIKLSQGVVRGCREELPNGKSFLRFSGIPYAKPPINELRFKSPQKLLKFEEDEIDCTKERDACFHRSTITKKHVGSEDCLNLNVYVPENRKSSEKFAVMVYIHGGGLKYDSNSRQLYSPEFLVMENVIIVTMNYRLHVLGFLYMPSKGIPGNAGMKDQQMALEWVYENISSFNGDPKKICLFGESSDLYENSDKVLSEQEEDQGVRYIWRTVIEPESDEAMITKSATDSIIDQTGQINIPMMFGTLNGDGMPSIAKVLSRNKLDLMNKLPYLFVPRKIGNLSDNEMKAFAKEIKQFYLNGKDLSIETLKDLVRLRTDVDYRFAIMRTSELYARYQPEVKQFLFEFRFDGRLNLQKKQMRLDHLPFAGHADDVFHLFGGELVDRVNLEKDSREWKMRETMCKLWTNFAKYDDPTPDYNNPLPFKWTSIAPITNKTQDISLNHLIIDDEMMMVENPHKESMEFWKKAYRKWNKEFIQAKL
ncbi:CLUMA_CG009229, isoform A [Clunio marinus]|uniref:carboxylesterase n=1 Tax=Clunio marinus TaxID=568069 RepID=A0A1J1I870_9DIPT|nr:CLUMA_CG009229, isoform A [Clunio marinus]